MREVTHQTDQAWAAFPKDGPIEGLTEHQAMDRLNQLMAERGSSRCRYLRERLNSAWPHYNTGDRVIERGDAVVSTGVAS